MLEQVRLRKYTKYVVFALQFTIFGYVAGYLTMLSSYPHMLAREFIESSRELNNTVGSPKQAQLKMPASELRYSPKDSFASYVYQVRGPYGERQVRFYFTTSAGRWRLTYMRILDAHPSHNIG